MKIYSTLTMAGYPKHSGILLGNFLLPCRDICSEEIQGCHCINPVCFEDRGVPALTKGMQD